MPPPEVTSKQIAFAYLHLYRWSLRAVQFSAPARYTVRDRLRKAFRSGSRADFDQQKINNTIEFLQGAAHFRGLEHTILRRLLMTWFHEPHARSKQADG